MWDLIANGLGLVGTGYSFVSGFSLDKKINAINASFEKLETLQSQVLDSVASHSLLANKLLPLLEAFRGESNPGEQLKTAQILAEYSRQLQADLESRTSTLLAGAISEMRNVIESVRLTQAPQQPAPGRFTRALYNDPFGTGVVEFQDISASGIWGVTEPYIVSPHLSPISWRDPMSGRQFLGKISISELQRYGIKTTTPKYLHTVGGHVYSASHGLYVPSYIVDGAG